MTWEIYTVLHFLAEKVLFESKLVENCWNGHWLVKTTISQEKIRKIELGEKHRKRFADMLVRNALTWKYID